MMTVREVSRTTGVSVRALQYYDSIGLLAPARVTEAGYRLYDGKSLEKLQQIMLFRELEFSLKDIKSIVNSPGFDREGALRQQIELLSLKKERLEGLIALAKRSLKEEEDSMSFKEFDTKKLDEYAAKAKEAWGETAAYKEYEVKAKGRSGKEDMDLAAEMMKIFEEFGKIKDKDPSCPEAQALVRKLQGFITANYYTCTKEILKGLGQAYAAGGEFTANIDKAGGKGTAGFAAAAIEAFCKS
ncbi:MAG: MerR family transcriptional regulator [Firmicutes bacterium]|nr:MerR family transcriptional regulator [Bacillota bacterium]